MNAFEKSLLPTAISDHTSLELNSSHLTTADFFQLQPVYYRHTMPREKLSVDMSTFSRLLPLPQPTLADVKIHNRAFFVPYRTIFKGWTAFITDAVHQPAFGLRQLQAKAPTMAMGSLQTAFNRPAFSIIASDVNPTNYNEKRGDWDFCYVNGSTFEFRKLTFRGRHAMKVLNALGYRIFWNYENRAIQLSALALMAWAKVYIDWYFPPQYYGTSTVIDALSQLLNQDTGAPITLTDGQVQDILDYTIFVNYDADYFTAAFDSPTGPSSAFSSLIIPDVNFTPSADPNRSAPNSHPLNTVGLSPVSFTGSSSVDDNMYPGTPVLGFSYNSTSNQSFLRVGTIDQYQLESLKKLTEYAKRNQMAGSRVLDRYLAKFGVTLAADKLDRCYYLGSMDVQVDFGDVMSNSDTFNESVSEGAQLGSYAGKGFALGQGGHFENQSDEYGIFIIMSSVVPRVGYVQGMDRHNYHIAKTDFFMNEFDGLGNQAIDCSELIVPIDAMHAGELSYDKIFGFIPRYAEYKRPLDFMTGDFANQSLSLTGFTGSGWHLNRLFSDIEQPPVHSESFVLGNATSRADSVTQYDRIFYTTGGSQDHFIVQHRFRVTAYAPCKPLYDTFEFDHDDEKQKVDIQVNGVRMN